MTGAPGNATVLDATVLSDSAHVDAVDLLLGLPLLVTVGEVETEMEPRVRPRVQSNPHP